jgi:prefoldin alpha subunit
MKKEDLQQRFVEFQMVDQQIKVLQQQLHVLEQQATEIARLIDDLEQLKTVKPNTPAFAHVGPGVAVEAIIKDANKVVMNVGAGAMVKKSIPDAQKTLHTQVEEIQHVMQRMQEEVQKLRNHATNLREDIRKAQESK